MGVYEEHVLPRLIDVTCGSSSFDRWRAQVCAGLSGRVVEIGFGSGTNVAFYPVEVDSVAAVEPSSSAMRLARTRISASRVRIEQVGRDGQSLALEDASCDAALCTFTLCTVEDPEATLLELRRVLRPGAALHFLEHGIAPDAPVARWQRRIDPWQVRLAGGCHVTRDPVAMLEATGFHVELTKQRYGKGPKPWSYFSMGRAVGS